MEDKRSIPRLVRGEYVAQSCGVCGVDDIIGTPADLCTLHFSDPAVEYDYGYDYIIVTDGDGVCGYYIGVDRFAEESGVLFKEYALYEFAVYDGTDGDAVADLLLAHLSALSKETGCSRILCRREGGNPPFRARLQREGFREEDGLLTLAQAGAVLPRRDALVIPRHGEALGFRELFFLREQGFCLTEETCRFACGDEWISVDRASGACRFSGIFRLLGGDEMVLDGARALSQLDVSCQLLKQGGYGCIELTLPAAKTEDIVPDVRADDGGIFFSDVPMTVKDRYILRSRLRAAGTLGRYACYHFHFDYEVGGSRVCLGFAKV